jgi:endonuclease/exonuclease/phosphatase family metal-dependent hydrolase
MEPSRRLVKAAAFLFLIHWANPAYAGNLEIAQESQREAYIQTSQPSVRFTVATYNVQARPVLDAAEQKFRAIGPLLDQFQIVALQECFTAHRLLWAQTTFPSRIHDGSKTAWYRLVSSGLSLLSRFRAKEASVQKFRDPAGLRYLFRAQKDGLASKGVLFARYDLGNGRLLDVYNTHMEAGGDETSSEARRIQAGELVHFVNSQSPPDNAVLLVGDFNMRPLGKRKSGRRQALRDPSSLERSQLLESISGQLGLTNAGSLAGRPPSKTLDHIFFRSGTKTQLKPVAWKVERSSFRDAAGNSWSDHDPVIATFIAE